MLDGKHDDVDEQLAKACATLLSNPDEQAIADISALGFGGIYVVADTQSMRLAGCRYSALRTVEHQYRRNGTPVPVSTDAGSYYRLTLQNADAQNVDTSWQQRTQHSVWRHARRYAYR